MVTAIYPHMHNHSHGSLSDIILPPENQMNMNTFTGPGALTRGNSDFYTFSGIPNNMYDTMFTPTKPNLMHQESYSYPSDTNQSAPIPPIPSLTSVPSYGSMVNFADPALARVLPTRSVSFMTSLTGEDEPQIDTNEQQVITIPSPLPLPLPVPVPNINSNQRMVHMDSDPSLLKGGSLRRFLPDGTVNNVAPRNYPIQPSVQPSSHGLRKRTATPLYPIVAHNSEYFGGYKAAFDPASVNTTYNDQEVGQKRSRHAVESSRLTVKSHESDGEADGESVDSHGSDAKRVKARHVSPAVKLVGNEEGNSSIVTTVTQMHYETKEKRHRIRLIRVQNMQTGSDNVYAHGADVGSVVERKSNISRLFGKFKSPQEKLLMNVPGPHNHTVGQESNILTVAGLQSFLHTNKMRGQTNYANWIVRELIPHIEDPKSTESLEAESDERPSQPRKSVPNTNALARVTKKSGSPISESAPQTYSPSSIKL